MTATLDRPTDPDRRASAVGPPERVDPSPPGWRTPVTIAALLVVLLVAVVAAGDQLSRATGTTGLPRLEVPNVTGLQVEEATARLEELSFVVTLRFQPNEDETKPRGTTFDQTPPAGAKVEQGGAVAIVVSDGPAGLVVPAVAGQQVGDAEAVLATNGFRSQVVEVPDDEAPAGEVLRSDPAPGSRAPLDGVITLVVSTGPPPRVVPEMVGSDVVAALATLGRAGLEVGSIDRVVREGEREGIVIGQEHPVGTELPRNWPVGLTVTGPPPTSTVPSIVGLSRGTAEDLVAAAGLLPDVRTRVVSSASQVGRVLSQNLPPYGEVAPGTPMQFVVGVAAAASPPPSAPPRLEE